MRKLLLLFLPVLLAYSCAQILSPGGGEKDHTPPKVVHYAPDSAATNFTGKRVVIRFNEYVQLNDLNNQLIVSPPMREQPDVTIRKKEIVVTFSDTLLPNTTYTISFGNAIRDITEGNVLENFRYVFSTGPVIDSMRFSGKVINASTMAGEKGVLVMLYKNTGDSVPMKQRPYYFAKTSADGSFQLTNLASGKYKVFALEDKNQDYLYNNNEERIAFPDQLLDLTASNVDTLTMRLFNEKPAKQRRTSFNQTPGNLSLVYALPLKNPTITFTPEIPAAMNPFIEKGVNGDSLNIWFSTVTLDSTVVIVKDDNNFRDSLPLRLLKMNEKKKGMGRGVGVQKPAFSANVQKGQNFDPAKTLSITSSIPIRDFKPQLFTFLQGKDTLRPEIRLSENKHTLLISQTLSPDSNYLLFIPPGAVTDWFGQKNDTLKINFHTQSTDAYGKLVVKPTGLPEGKYILQVVTDKDQVIAEKNITGAAPVAFEHLVAGQYRLKLINDTNGNGKWDTGNYLQQQQPERVTYYSTPVRMRAGWDMDVEWIFSK